MIGSSRLTRLSTKDLHLFVVVVGDLVEHRVEVAGLLAHVDHVDDDVVDDPRLSKRLGDRLALADALINPRERPLEDGMLPAVSRTIFNASRIGTPDWTSVPSVRIVRATVDFSVIVAHDRDHQPDPVAGRISARSCSGRGA